MQYVSSTKFVAVYLFNRIIDFSFNTPLFNINAVLTGKTGWLYKDSKLKTVPTCKNQKFMSHTFW